MHVLRDFFCLLNAVVVATLLGSFFTVAKAKSPDPAVGDRVNYVHALQKHILSHIKFDPAKAPDNPEVIFRVEQRPTGRIVRTTKIQPSGNKEWDSAVERALWKSSPLPKMYDDRVEEVLEISFRPHYLFCCE